LLKLKEMRPENLLIVRYEDMVASIDYLKPVFEFCGVEVGEDDKAFFHSRSVAKYRKDRRFGFELSDEVAEVAHAFGYTDSDLRNEPRGVWPVYRRTARLRHLLVKSVRDMARRMIIRR
jgi:hypothetical protein